MKNPWDYLEAAGDTPPQPGDVSSLKPWEHLNKESSSVAPRGTAEEVGQQFRAGIAIDIPKMFGQAMEWFGGKGSRLAAGGEYLRTGAEMVEESNPELAPQVEGHGIVRRALSGGARAIPASSALIVPAVAAAPLGAAGVTAASAAGAFGLFGASQAQETYEKLKKVGVSDDDAQRAGYINMMIEGAGETLGTYFGAKLFGIGAKAVGAGLSPVQAAIAGQTSKEVWMPFAKQLPKTVLVESATEFGQNYAETAVERAHGSTGGPEPLEAGVHGAEAALGMTALLAPFGLSGFAARAKRNERVADALQNPEANPVERAAASKLVYDDLLKVDEAAAKTWAENSAIAISGKAPIVLDESFTQKQNPAEKILTAKTADEAIAAALDGATMADLGDFNVGAVADTPQFRRGLVQAQIDALVEPAYAQKAEQDQNVQAAQTAVAEAQLASQQQRVAMEGSSQSPSLVAPEKEAATAETARLLQESEGQKIAQELVALRAKGQNTAMSAAMEKLLLKRLDALGFNDPQENPNGQELRSQSPASRTGVQVTPVESPKPVVPSPGAEGVGRPGDVQARTPVAAAQASASAAPAASEASQGQPQAAPATEAPDVPRGATSATGSRAGVSAVSVEQSGRAQEDVQRVRRNESADSAAVLPRVSRGADAAEQAQAQRDVAGRADAGERAGARQRVPEAGKTGEGRVRVRGDEGSDAPRRLQQAASGDVDVPGVSPEVARNDRARTPYSNASNTTLERIVKQGGKSARAAELELQHRAAVRARVAQENRKRIESAPDEDVAGMEAMANEGGQPLYSVAEVGEATGLDLAPAEQKDVPVTARLTAKVVTKALGKRVVFVKGGVTGQATEGVVMSDDPSTVYVNVNSTRKWQSLIGHETTHALKRTNAKVYSELREAVNAALDDKAFTWAANKYAERTADIQNEELVANVVGDQMHDARFWVEVFKQTKDVRALANAMFSVIDKMMSKITKTERLDYNTKEFIKDARAVRSAVAKAYSQWEKDAKQRNESGVQNGKTGSEALQSKADREGRRDQTAGDSSANPIVTARQAVAHDKANPLKESRKGRCHQLAWRKVVKEDLHQLIGVVNGWPSAPQPRAPIKIWHSFAFDPKTGSVWEPISDRWYSLAAMKAFGFEPVVSITPEKAAALAVKTGVVPDQQIYSENVKPLKGAESDWLQPGDYKPDWKAVARGNALQSKPTEKSRNQIIDEIVGAQRRDDAWMIREKAIDKKRGGDPSRWDEMIKLAEKRLPELRKELMRLPTDKLRERLSMDLSDEEFFDEMEGKPDRKALHSKPDTASDKWYYSPLAREIEKLPASRIPTDGLSPKEWMALLVEPEAKRTVGIRDENNKRTGKTKEIVSPARSRLNDVKMEEIEWSGIEEWLDLQSGKPGSITIDELNDMPQEEQDRVIKFKREGKLTEVKVSKQAVLDYLSGNSVQVVDTIKADALKAGSVDDSEVRDYNEMSADLWSRLTEEDREDLRAEFAADESGEGADRFNRPDLMLPGGKNPVTILVRLADKKPTLPDGYSVVKNQHSIKAETAYIVTNKDGERVAHGATEEEALRHFRSWREVEGSGFVGGHYDEENVVVHVRGAEHKGAAGERVFVVNEIQSDWGQKGKKEGFRDEFVLPDGWSVQKRSGGDFGVFDPDGNLIRHGATEQEALDRSRRSGIVGAAEGGGSVPLAPFVTKTESWVALAIKRTIAYAVEHGFTKIAWTTGSQQVQRYEDSLREHVDQIEWTKTPEGVQLVGYKGNDSAPDPESLRGATVMQNGDFETYAVYGRGDGPPLSPMFDTIDRARDWLAAARANKDARTKVVDTTEKESVLSDAIGKVMADRIINDPNQSGVIEGDDIAISDTGMTNFYDKIVKNVANDVLKKLGGGRVGVVNIGKADVRGIDWSLKKGSGGNWRATVGEENGSFESEDSGQKWVDERIGLKEQPGFDLKPEWKGVKMPLFSKPDDAGISARDDYSSNSPMNTGDSGLKESGRANAWADNSAANRAKITQANRGRRIRVMWMEPLSRGGTWTSLTEDGRYVIEPNYDKEKGGYISYVDGVEIGQDETRTDAIYRLNDKYEEDIADGKAKDPSEGKNVLKNVKPHIIANVVDAWRHLATAKNIFLSPRSSSKDLKTVLKEFDSGKEKLFQTVTLMRADTAEKKWLVTFANSKVGFVVENSVEKTAYLDAANFEKGSRFGSFFYPAVLTWAHNNGLKLMVDPNGLSGINELRRTEQMMSAALKYGRTDFMSPTSYDGRRDHQELMGWKENPKNQKEEDRNLALLIFRNMKNTLSVLPVLEDWRYNFKKRRFEDANGEVVDRKRFESLSTPVLRNDYGIGPTTMARAIFTNSIIEEAPGFEKFIDGDIAPDSLLGDVEKGERTLALYSKPPSYANTPVAIEAARKAGLYREEKPFMQRVKEMMPTFAKRMRQGLVDQFAPIKEVSFRAYMQARMSKGADGALEAMFLYGKPFLEDGALNVNMQDGGLTKLLQRLGGEHDRFIAWIAGNRAAQLKTEGRERLFEDAEIDWLKNLNQGQMPGGGSRAALYAQVHREWNAYSKAVLDIAEEQGLIDPESRSVWEKDFYVPFYRNMDAEVSGPTVKSGLISQQAFKRLKGGKEDLNDLLANTLQNWSHLLSAAMKNKAALSTMEAAVQAGAAIEVATEYQGKQMQIGKVLKALDSGAERYFVLEDPFLVDAISSLESFSFGPIGKIFETTKRWLTIGVTANPSFKIRNLIRDSISAIGVSELSYNPAKNVASAWADTAHSSQTRATLLASGGIIRFGTQLEGSRAEYVRDLIAEGVPASQVIDTKDKLVAMLKLAWDHYQEFGDRGENVNRTALYKKMRAEGKDHLEASYAARDLMDFSMQGTWRAIRFLTQTVPFFNARLQGLYKGGRGAVENPRRMGYVMGAVAFASIALLLAYKDDDDWKKREEWDRDNFWWFKIGDKAFRIPKPFEIGAMGTMAERLVEYAVSDEMTGKRLAERMGHIISDNLAMNPIPQIARPLIELYANKDFFRGRPIETMGMEKLSPSERIGRGTSAGAQLAGKANILSPVQIDHVIRSYFGWLGASATTILDYGLRPTIGLPEKPASTLRDVFVVGNFMESLPTGTSRYVTDFYESSKTIEQAYADWRHAINTRQPERANEIRESQKDKIVMHGAVSATNKQLAAYNKLEKLIESDRSMTPEEKRKRLDRLDTLKNETARRYSDLVLKRRGAEASVP